MVEGGSGIGSVGADLDEACHPGGFDPKKRVEEIILVEAETEKIYQ